MCIIRFLSVTLVIIFTIICYFINLSINKMSNYNEKYGSMEKYTFHKYEDVPRKYSNKIEELLKNDSDFIEDKSDNIMVDWSDKNSKSRVKDYYPFPKISFIDKKYLPLLFRNIVPNTYVQGDFNKFIKKTNKNVFFLKPSDKYIGGSHGIEIDSDPYKLYDRYLELNKGKKESKYIIQEEIQPMIIDGYKFDIRSYVLIAYNNNYMHIYYNYGIIRYCKEPYIKGSTDPDRQISIHGKYEYVIDNELLKPYLTSIKDIIYTTLVDLKIPNGIGYQYLGYDIIISSTGSPYLIEINIQPDMKRVNYDIDILRYFPKLVIKSVLTTNRGYRPFISKTNLLQNDDEIILAEPNMSHIIELYKITKDISIMQYIGNLKPWSYEKTKKFIEYGPSENYYYKAIIIRNQLLGIIGIYRNKTIHYNLTIYLNKNSIGKGVGKSALKLFLLTVETDKIFADVLNTNIRSIAFFKKMGYIYTVLDNIHRFKVI